MRTPRGWLFFSAPAAIGLLAALLAGCDSPAMVRAREVREQSLSRSLKTVQSLEDRREENLARTHRLIADRLDRDAENSERNVEIVGRLIDEEFETWAQKEPAYRRAIGRELKGDASRIERTLPHFIY